MVKLCVCLQHGIVVVRKKQQPNELSQLYASDVSSKLEKIHIVSLMGMYVRTWLLSSVVTKDRSQSVAAHTLCSTEFW